MHDTWTGSQTATIAFMNVNDNTLEILAYRSDTHSMTPFLTTPLHFEGMWRPYSCGGKMYLAWDLHRVMGGYPEGQLMASAMQPAGLDINHIDMDIEARDEWGIIISENPTSDSASIYSYNIASGNTMTHLQTEGSYFSTLMGYNNNVAGILATTSSGYKLFLYSPAFDQWTQKESGPNSPSFTICRDFIYYRERNSNILSVFDGVTNQELDLGYNSGSDYIYPGDDFLVAYTSENKFVSYSATTRTSSEYESDRYSYIRGDQSIWTSQKGNYDILAYNSISDSFIPLTLTDTQGLCKNINVGGKTALILTINGYLLAFDPYKDSGTAIYNDKQDRNIPKVFHLAQNYPNPFNPFTTIAFDLPVNAHVQLDIYNTLGEKVSRLVDKDLQAGKYRYNWHAEGLASGIYFYVIQSRDFRAVKRMVFIK
jgi:hypothetical protein